MEPIQIDQHTRSDSNEKMHHVRVMQHFHEVAGNLRNPEPHWEKSDCLRFIVDDLYEIKQDRRDNDLIDVPGLGKLIRSS